jgi:ABC-2 type transport system permease protein
MSRRDALGLLLHQTRFDLLAVRGDRQARFTTLLLPVLLLVVVIGVTGHDPIRDQGVVLRPATYFAPGLIAFAVLATCLLALVVELVVARETGVLKRRRAQPVPAWALVGGRTLAAVATSLAAGAVLLVVATNGYDAQVPAAAVPALAIMVVAGAASLSALAYALSTVIRSSAAAQPVVAIIALPLYLVSGVFFPASRLPRGLDAAAHVLPLEHLAHGLRHAVLPAAGGLRIESTDLGVLIAWAVAGLVIAVRRFEWLPRAAA